MPTNETLAAQSMRGVWKSKAQELKQPLANLFLHVCEGALAVVIAGKLGTKPEHAAMVASAFGPAWEVGGYYASGKKRKWKASILGAVTFAIGAAGGLLIVR